MATLTIRLPDEKHSRLKENGSIPILQKYNLVVRASCSLDIHSEQDARTTKDKFPHLGCSQENRES